MRKMIRQFTFHNPKGIIQPTLWLFLSTAVSMLPATLTFMAIHTIGGAFFPPYTLDTGLLVKLAIGGVICFALQYIVELVSYYQTYFKAYGGSAAKRIAYIQKLRKLPLGFFSSKESGEFISSFSTDFSNLEQALCYWLPYPLGVGLLLVVAFVWITVFDWRMALAIFAVVPVAALLMLAAAKEREKNSGEVLRAKSDAATQVNEYFHGMKDLKAYHCTGKGFQAMDGAFQRLRDISQKDEVKAGSLSTLCAMMPLFMVPVTVCVGMALLIGGSLSVLDFASFIVMATKLTEPVSMVVVSISALRGLAASGQRLDDVMMTPDPSGSETLARGDSYTFEDVSFRYEQGENVIDGVSFTTPPGALTALIGPSGSGKSTLIRLMARFWDYQSGQVRLEGKDLHDIQPDSLLSQISMVMQNTTLFHGTVRENLTFGNEAIIEEDMVEACKKARCHEFIEKLPKGYDTHVGEGGATLSGGERQRISLARAFLKDVPILLLDEPTASLDADNEALVQQALDEIAKERTVIMIAHRLKTVRGAQQILVLDKGKITEQGGHEQMVRHGGLYARLWQLQSEAAAYYFRK